MKILIDNRTQLSEICMFKILEKIYDKVNNLASEEAKEWVERQANEKYEEIFGECEE